MTIRRRDLIAGAMAVPLVAHAAHAARAAHAAIPDAGLAPVGTSAPGPDDTAYWTGIAAQYDVTREVIQLENGNWGMMVRPVLAAYAAHVERVNRDSSYYARRGMAADLAAVRARVAETLKAAPDEVVLTRNASEALRALIVGYNRLKPGDSILYADLDYDSMQTCMRALGVRSGATVRRIALPEPASHQGLIDAYAAAFEADPKIRLVLLTHLSHRTGLVLPVREIVALARARGIDAIVDAAHSWGQLDFALPYLDADFVGLNIHKWIGAPLGVGAVYIRKARIGAIDIDPASEPADTIDARVHIGTVDYAAALTVPQALDFQAAIGAPARAARLRWLRDRWVARARAIDGIEVLTPDDPRLHGSITSFRLRGLNSDADNVRVAQALLEQHRIFTVYRGGVAKGSCVRVTPALFNGPADVDALGTALASVAKTMLR